MTVYTSTEHKNEFHLNEKTWTTSAQTFFFFFSVMLENHIWSVAGLDFFVNL